MMYRTTASLLCLLALVGCSQPTANEVADADTTSSSPLVANSGESVPGAGGELNAADGIIRNWDGRDPEQPRPLGEGSSNYMKFTAEGLRQFAPNRTKAYFRSMFGPPDEVDEANDQWVYFAANNHLNVVDEDAGKQVFVRLQFAPDTEGTDRVESVELF